MLLLCPSLREVSISFKPGPSGGGTLPDIVGPLLENLALTAPKLTFLCLFGDHPLDRKNLLYLDRFTSMVEMGLSDSFILDEAVLQGLSRIPTLEVLTGCSIRLEGADGAEALDFGDGFRALNNITLKGTSRDLFRVVAGLSKTALNSLSLEFTDSPSMDAVGTPFNALAPHLPTTITQYNATFRAAALSPLPVALANLIHPLLSKMPKLNDFDLSAEKSSLSVTNDDLLRIGDAWPHLTRLSIEQSPTRSNLHDVRRPDVSGLAELAKRCPKLEMISLPELDASKPTEPRAVPFLGHRLKRLLFQSASIVPARALHEAAVAISIMFPHLELDDMQPRAYPPARVNTQWSHIWRTLEIMRWGRKYYELSESGCESTVPEVPELNNPSDRDDR